MTKRLTNNMTALQNRKLPASQRLTPAISPTGKLPELSISPKKKVTFKLQKVNVKFGPPLRLTR